MSLAYILTPLFRYGFRCEGISTNGEYGPLSGLRKSRTEDSPSNRLSSLFSIAYIEIKICVDLARQVSKAFLYERLSDILPVQVP